jgi:hypothetical protein
LIRPLDRTQNLHEFPEAISLGVAMESVLSDEEVWSARLESRLQMAITFDPLVGSRLNVYMIF